MPIYEYRCSACGHRMEALQKMSDAPLQECPACHESKLEKQVTAAAGVQMKSSSKNQNIPPCAASGCGAACQRD